MKPTPLSPSGIYLGEERNQNMHEVSGIDRRIHVFRSKIGDENTEKLQFLKRILLEKNFCSDIVGSNIRMSYKSSYKPLLPLV